jgi:3-methyl-2-oxobutanoate hydroxymethyltransferase
MTPRSETTLYPGTAPHRRLTVRDIAAAKSRRERWPMLTAYDAQTARVFDTAGIPVLLIGDSAGMVVYGQEQTTAVTVDELLPLVRAVARSTHRAMVVADLPFGSYQATPVHAFDTATRMIKEGGAGAVKVEGGIRVAPHIELMVSAGIPVMGHIGLTPQSVLTLGGYRVQGRGDGAAERLLADAAAVSDAGAFAVVLEAVPAELAQRVTTSLAIPTIGIGAGPHCDAQVLVWQDMAGLTPEPLPRFVKRYANLADTLTTAVTQFGADVANGVFPGDEHSYH